MAELEILEEMGLSHTEARVYLVLLESGSTLVGPIIKKANLHRATTYQILQRMREKGVVSSVVKGKKHYLSALDPARLLDLLKQREHRYQEILPALKSLAAASKEPQEVTVYSGVKGVRSALDAMLEELGAGGAYYDFGVSGLFREVMGGYWDHWQRMKRKRKILSLVIFTSSLKKSKLLEDYYGKARFHPKEYASLTDTIIYKDTVILFIWTSKPPLAIVIKNKENARSYLNQFRLMWRYAKR